MKSVPKTLWCSTLTALLFLLTNTGVFAAEADRATPQITVGATSGYITSCQGTASASPNIEQFTVSGSNLSGNVTVTAPANFEISINSTSLYSNNITMGTSGGVLNNTMIYVRSAASAPAGKISGNIVVSSPGATSVNVFVNGTINIVPTVSTGASSQEVVTGNATSPLLFSGPGDVFTWTNNNPSIGLAASGSGNIASFTAVNSGSSPITATITVSPQQIAYAYIGNVGDNTISVINTATNQVVKTMTQIDKAPTGFTVSPDGKSVYVTSFMTNDGYDIISPATNTEIAGFAAMLNTAPLGITISPDGTRLYVANNGVGNVVAQDPTRGNTLATYVVGGKPIGVTVTPDGSKLFVTNSAAPLTIINLPNGAITTINALNNTYSSCVSPDGNFLYVTLPAGNIVDVYDIAKNAIMATIPVGTKPEGINISPDGRTLYVTNNGSGNVSVINTANNQVTATITVGTAPYGVCSTSDGQFVYVTNQGSNSVSVINTSTNMVSATIPVGSSPSSLGNFILPTSACAAQPSTFTIQVDPKPGPVITQKSITGGITACVGTASADPNLGYITVLGNNLSTPVTVTASSDFEVSLNPSTGYAGSIQIDETLGTTGNAMVYVRSTAAAPVGNVPGSVSLTANGATSVTVPLNAQIAPLPVVYPISNQTVTNGNATAAVNFTGTASGYTWTNNTPSIGLAASGSGNIPSFTATNTTQAPVTATITVTPEPTGTTTVCEGVPVSFTITVLPTGTTTNSGGAQGDIIPNAFTPNGDGINDTWEIKLLTKYPNCTVNVYSRWGEKLYASIGYSIPWDGSYNGVGLPNDDVKGQGDEQDYGSRIYDPRVGRFLSMDPLTKEYAELTPYQFASNSSVSNVDLDGNEALNWASAIQAKTRGVETLRLNNATDIQDVQFQQYRLIIEKPEKNVNELFNQIASNIGSIYNTDYGKFKFEKQANRNTVSTGDYIKITPSQFGLTSMFVKVTQTDMVKDKDGNVMSFSMKFRTLQGHAEVGAINFSATMMKAKDGTPYLHFMIESTSQVDPTVGQMLDGISKTVRDQQADNWSQTMGNILNFMGGTKKEASEYYETYENGLFKDDFKQSLNDPLSIGTPNGAPKSINQRDLPAKPPTNQ